MTTTDGQRGDRRPAPIGALDERYLALLRRALTGTAGTPYETIIPARRSARLAMSALRRLLAPLGVELLRRSDPRDCHVGRVFTAVGDTMVGIARLEQIERCVRTVLADGVPGDLMETGVWRGGASIYMRALLDVLGDERREVWLADSFQGLPRPDAERYPVDEGDILWQDSHYLGASLDTVKANFSRYGLLDERVRFLPGWFRDTLPGAPVERLAVLRLDGDLYESTIVALDSLYDRVAPGGFVIVDDYGLPTCAQAVEDFRRRRGIDDDLVRVDWTGAHWRKSG